MANPTSQNASAPALSKEDFDRAAKVAYPAAADSRGHARVSWKGKTFYFGEHNTADSWDLFCRWRADLIETGTAKSPKKLRVDGAHVAAKSSSPTQSISENWKIAIACITTAVAVFGLMQLQAAPAESVEKPSTSAATVVDGQTISDTERLAIRGVRIHRAIAASERSDNPTSRAAILHRLTKEGPGNAPQHRRPGYEFKTYSAAKIAAERDGGSSAGDGGDDRNHTRRQ